MKKELSEEEKELNEKKKEYLKQYKKSVCAVKRIEEQIKELETEEMYPSAVCLNGITVTTSYNDRDLSAYIAKKEEFLSELIKARYKRIKMHQEVFNQIESMENEDEKEILTLRYIDNMKWEGIASHMHMARSWVFCLHEQALTNFVLPERRD